MGACIDAMRNPTKPRPEGEVILAEMVRQYVTVTDHFLGRSAIHSCQYTQVLGTRSHLRDSAGRGVVCRGLHRVPQQRRGGRGVAGSRLTGAHPGGIRRDSHQGRRCPTNTSYRRALLLLTRERALSPDGLRGHEDRVRADHDR